MFMITQTEEKRKFFCIKKELEFSSSLMLKIQ